MTESQNLSPRAIVDRLEEYIIGQDEAKRAVAVALRNRYRRLQLDEDMQKEITPKNILMIGSTGVGKTEIARRLADIIDAPFIKVEATKFTEVGYVGRDVESMIRDLTEVAARKVRAEKAESLRPKARRKAIEDVAAALVPGEKQASPLESFPFSNMFGGSSEDMDRLYEQTRTEKVTPEVQSRREEMVQKIKSGQVSNEQVTIKVKEQNQGAGPMIPGMEQMGLDLSAMMPDRYVDRTMTVDEAVEVLTDQEAQSMVKTEDIQKETVELVENYGIVFLDEIDKITSKNQKGSGEVSREGVQRDILPIVEGSAVNTKYGVVNTDHILFIGSGAFSMSKPSDLIPELQGRFPIRVELDDLSQEDFFRILSEPKNSLIRQYQALLKTEGVDVVFTHEAVEEIAEMAYQVNNTTDNIGARRLHTIVEKVLEELLFEAPDMHGAEVQITRQYVQDRVGDIAEDQDLSRYVL